MNTSLLVRELILKIDNIIKNKNLECWSFSSLEILLAATQDETKTRKIKNLAEQLDLESED